MKRNITLTITAFVTLVLSMLHVTDDTVHARDGVDLSGTIILLLIMLVFLYAIVELGGRRLGYFLMLLGGLGAAYMPFLHGLGARSTRWGFFFVWTLLALGVSGAFSAILSAGALLRSFRKRTTPDIA
jgi:hypothetical protein